MRRICALLAFMLLLFAVGQGAQQASKTLVAVDPTGSIPPLPMLYSCVGELYGKLYQPIEADSCLHSILASGYFETGRITSKPIGPNMVVHFRLKAKSLRMADLNYDIEGALSERTLAWIHQTPGLIRAGDVYQPRLDDKTKKALGFFFGDVGKRASISRVVNLDYRSGIATLTYKISVGPDMIPMRASPYQSPCDQPVVDFAVTDIDDYVPINLVEKMTKTHAFGCFDASALANDNATLQNSNLFLEARYDVLAKGLGRDVSVHIRGKQLKVSQAKVVGYGLLAGRPFENETVPDLKSGDIYRRSAPAGASLVYLQKKYAQPNEIVELFEDDQLTSDNQLLVTFQILACDEDTVILDGKEFRVAPVVISGTSEAR